MAEFREVTEAEIAEWVAAYPRPLVKDLYRIADPHILTWNDFALGVWPESVVAKRHLSRDWGGPVDKCYVLVEIPDVVAPEPEAARRTDRNNGYMTWVHSDPNMPPYWINNVAYGTVLPAEQALPDEFKRRIPKPPGYAD